MNMNKKWFVALVLFALQLSDYVSSNPLEIGKLIRTKRGFICNLGLTYIIADALHDGLKEIHSLDPLNITNELSILHRIRIHGGTLKGLSTLINLTELKVFCIDDDVVVLNTILRMKNAEIYYRWTSKLLFKLQGSVWMKADVVDYGLEISLNTTAGMNFKVTDSLITRMEDITFGFEGFGYFNLLVKAVMKWLFMIFKVKTETRIAFMLKEVMEEKLDEIAEYLNNSYLLWLLVKF